MQGILGRVNEVRRALKLIKSFHILLTREKLEQSVRLTINLILFSFYLSVRSSYVSVATVLR